MKKFVICFIAFLLMNTGYAIAEPENKSDKKEVKKVDRIVVTADGSQVVLPEVYSGGQVARGFRAGILGNLDMMDTPFVSTNYTSEFMKDQQVESVADVLKNDPAVQISKGFGNFQELYMVRGFPVYSDDMTYNGLFGILPRQFVASEFLERVEVFRGANSFINGATPGGSGVGGSFNLVPKRATDDPLSNYTFGFSGNSQIYNAFDFGHRYGENKEFGVRFNIANRFGETSVDDQETDLSVFSLGLDYAGDKFRLSADIGYQNQKIDSPRPSVTPSGGIPSAPDSSSNYAQDWTYTDEEQFFGVLRGEYDLNDSTMVWLAFGIREGEEENRLASPTASADGSMTIYRFDNHRIDTVYSGDTGIRTEFSTGEINHRVTLSTSWLLSEEKNAYGMSATFSGDLYNPSNAAMPAYSYSGGDLSDPLVTQKTDTSSVALADSLSFYNDRFIVIVGARYQNINKESFNYDTGASLSKYEKNKITPMAGIVYKPSVNISLYTNYSESLIPGEVAPDEHNSNPVTNAGEVFEPYTAEQYEVGVKYDNGKFGGSLSIFTITLPSSRFEGDTFVISGEQRNSGIELSLFGNPVENVKLLGGVTYLAATLENTQDGNNDGNTAIGRPEVQMNLNAEWEVPFITGFSLSGRGIYTSKQYADEANTISIPSWTRFDVGAKYKLKAWGRNIALRVNVENLFDKDYWASVGGYPGANYMILGDPRTLAMSCSVDF